MGWDDNGLPTERRVQNYFGVRCDPSLPYDPDFAAARRALGEAAGRRLAAELRRAVPAADRERRAGLRGAVAHARAVGRLVDDLHDDRPRARSASRSARSCGCSQRGAGLSARGADAVGRRLPDRRRAGRARGPRAPGRDAPRPLRARADGGGEALIETTRPELIPACVALVAHPDDERYSALVRHGGADAAVRHARAGAERIRSSIPRRAPAS